MSTALPGTVCVESLFRHPSVERRSEIYSKRSGNTKWISIRESETNTLEPVSLLSSLSLLSDSLPVPRPSRGLDASLSTCAI